jgi:hypothetical protein
MRHTMRKRTRLPRARPRQDQNRPPKSGGGFALFRIEAGKVGHWWRFQFSNINYQKPKGLILET